MIVPPNKQTIYSEFIEEPLRSHKGTSRFTQIKNKLSANEKSTLVDLTPVLLKIKMRMHCFSKVIHIGHPMALTSDTPQLQKK